jgi:DNA-binding response OmpR family regulator
MPLAVKEKHRGRKVRDLNISPLAGRTILIVEDAYLIALEAQQIAQEAGAERVVLARGVQEARTILAVEPKIDICVLDLKLGEDDATPLIGEVSSRGIAVLVATGFDSVTPSINVPLIRKPYQDREFVEAIRATLLGRR